MKNCLSRIPWNQVRYSELLMNLESFIIEGEKTDSLQFPCRSPNPAKHCIIAWCNQFDSLLVSSDSIPPDRAIISIYSNDLKFHSIV